MRALLILSVLAAAPAAAQTQLPQPPFRSTYIEATCSGGFAGGSDTVRIMPDGRVMRSSVRPPLLTRSKVAPARFAALSQRLDRAGFDQRTSPRPTVRIPDGIDCALTRVQAGVPHSVTLTQAARDMPAMRDLSGITNDVMALGREAAAPRMRPAARN